MILCFMCGTPPIEHQAWRPGSAFFCECGSTVTYCDVRHGPRDGEWTWAVRENRLQPLGAELLLCPVRGLMLCKNGGNPASVEPGYRTRDVIARLEDRFRERRVRAVLES